MVTLALAIAAPVPKPTAKRIEDVFGTISDPKTKCKFEMSTDGALTVRVPGDEVSRHDKPLVTKTVNGDFVLTVRVTHTVPKEAQSSDMRLNPMVAAGVVCRAEEGDPLVLITHKLILGEAERKWMTLWFARAFSSQADGNGGNNKDNVDGLTTSHLRLTRRGDEFTFESSLDGVTWVKRDELTGRQMPLSASVGLVVYHNINREYAVTFDQYEIKPLKAPHK